MTNGRSAAAVGMASFMTKKKKYKFQVDICLEELLEVPFISAVLFAKLRLLDGGSFQDHSSREEVKDHKVSWGAKFTFPCKMMANASTGVLERCVLRISIRKESKGGRSFNKLGFVDLNLAEYAGSGTIFKKALLEGYDARHRQDNSLLKFSIAMNMLSGDVLFKVPSPSPRPKSATAEEPPSDQRTDDYSGGSLGGSIASGSSGFGSLPKKRPALLSSELVIGQKLSENNIPVTVASDFSDATQVPLEFEDFPLGEPGHSRNSSNTSQLSKASGYSSIHSHSHSRQSSSGDSGHIRKLHSSLRIASFYKSSKFSRNNSFPTKNSLISHSNVPSIPSTIPSEREAGQKTLVNKKLPTIQLSGDDSVYSTPNSTFTKQISNTSTSSNEEYKTPQSTASEHRSDVFSKSFHEIQKSFSMTVVEFGGDVRRESNGDALHLEMPPSYGSDNVVLRSKSDYELGPISSKKSWLSAKIPESLYAFLTPSPQRKNVPQSTPTRPVTVSNPCRVPSYPQTKQSLQSLPESTRSLNCLQIGGTATGETNGQPLGVQPVRRQHRKLLDCSSAGGKLTPLAISPDESNQPQTDSAPQNSQVTVRRPSGTTNPSSSSLALSETGSLDRAKAAYERRKKTQLLDCDNVQVTGRVENTRVNPDHLIEDLLKNTNLEPVDDEAETSGLQLFIAKDGTAALGNHEVKSQMSTGVQLFKQVVMDDNR